MAKQQDSSFHVYMYIIQFSFVNISAFWFYLRGEFGTGNHIEQAQIIAQDGFKADFNSRTGHRRFFYENYHWDRFQKRSQSCLETCSFLP